MKKPQLSWKSQNQTFGRTPTTCRGKFVLKKNIFGVTERLVLLLQICVSFLERQNVF